MEDAQETDIDFVSVIEIRFCEDCRFNKEKVRTHEYGKLSTLILCSRKDCDNWKS